MPISVPGTAPSIGGTLTSATAGSVLFAATGPVIQQDNTNFFWDDTNNFLGLTTAVPTHTLTMSSAATGFSIYTTADQTTNYNRWTIARSGANFAITEERAGSNTGDGTISLIACTSASITTLAVKRTSLPFLNLTCTVSGVAGTQYQFVPLGSGSSGTQVGVGITPTYTQTSTAAATDLLINRTQTGVGSGLQSFLDCQVAGTSLFRLDNLGHPVISTTVTAGGTTGNQTINKPTGTVNIAAAGTTVTVTNSLCTTSSIVLCVIRTNDSTGTLKNVVPGSGSFVITLTAAATAELSIGFLVIN